MKTRNEIWNGHVCLWRNARDRAASIEMGSSNGALWMSPRNWRCNNIGHCRGLSFRASAEERKSSGRGCNNTPLASSATRPLNAANKNNTRAQALNAGEGRKEERARKESSVNYKNNTGSIEQLPGSISRAPENTRANGWRLLDVWMANFGANFWGVGSWWILVKDFSCVCMILKEWKSILQYIVGNECVFS